jgi:hypothetical protein
LKTEEITLTARRIEADFELVLKWELIDLGRRAILALHIYKIHENDNTNLYKA